jgi:hypothetical protein
LTLVFCGVRLGTTNTQTQPRKMINQIASHLQVSDESILRLEVWQHILFVVVKGLGSRFVSKKILEKKEQMYSYYELADKICDAINDSDTSFSANLWDKKEGETRVYVYQEGSKKRKDCGHIKVSSGGIERNLTAQAGTIENLYYHLKDLVISEHEEQSEGAVQFEIFYCHSLNGSGEWRVDAEDSSYSYFVQGLLGNINSLEQSAEKVLKSKGVSTAMCFKIREGDLQRHQNELLSRTALAGA